MAQPCLKVTWVRQRNPQSDLGLPTLGSAEKTQTHLLPCSTSQKPLLELEEVQYVALWERERQRDRQREWERENGSRNVNRDKSQDTKEKEIGNSEGADPLPSSNTQDCVVECETCSLSGQHSRNGPVDESTGEPRAKSENRSIGTLVSCLIWYKKMGRGKWPFPHTYKCWEGRRADPMVIRAGELSLFPNSCNIQENKPTPHQRSKIASTLLVQVWVSQPRRCEQGRAIPILICLMAA